MAAWSAWHDLAAPPATLRLAPTLLSGMSFRWTRVLDAGGGDDDQTFVGVVGCTLYQLRETAVTTWWRARCGDGGGGGGVAEAEAEAALRKHLSLDRGVEPSEWAQYTSLPEYWHAADALPGVRVLSVLSKLECLVAFVGSANNNIKRNMQMVAALCAEFPQNGVGRDARGGAHHAFPSTEQLCTLSEARLWQIGWGYRAPRLHTLARQLAERGGEM